MHAHTHTFWTLVDGSLETVALRGFLAKTLKCCLKSLNADAFPPLSSLRELLPFLPIPPPMEELSLESEPQQTISWFLLLLPDWLSFRLLKKNPSLDVCLLLEIQYLRGTFSDSPLLF